MAITFKEFQSKAEQVEIHPERTDQPWIYALTGLTEASGKFSKTLEAGLPNGELTPEERGKAIECAWKLLWSLTVACNLAGISLEEAAERGLSEMDHLGDHLLP